MSRNIIYLWGTLRLSLRNKIIYNSDWKRSFKSESVLLIQSIYLSLGAPDNRGTEFIIGFMDNWGTDFDCELFVTTARTTVVSVKVDSPKCSSPRISASFSITAGQVKQLFFNNKIRMVGSSKSSKGMCHYCFTTFWLNVENLCLNVWTELTKMS
jgi:hypothetical protein